MKKVIGHLSLDSCCTELSIHSGGMASLYQFERMGDYQMISMDSDGKYVYQEIRGGNQDQYLSFVMDQGLWMVGEGIHVNDGGIRNRNNGLCPEGNYFVNLVINLAFVYFTVKQ